MVVTTFDLCLGKAQGIMSGLYNWYRSHKIYESGGIERDRLRIEAELLNTVHPIYQVPGLRVYYEKERNGHSIHGQFESFNALVRAAKIMKSHCSTFESHSSALSFSPVRSHRTIHFTISCIFLSTRYRWLDILPRSLHPYRCISSTPQGHLPGIMAAVAAPFSFQAFKSHHDRSSAPHR